MCGEFRVDERKAFVNECKAGVHAAESWCYVRWKMGFQKTIRQGVSFSF